MFRLQRMTRRLLAVSAAAVCVAVVASSASAAEQTVVKRLTDTVTFMPTLAGGDREFGGNGPKVNVLVKFFVVHSAVYRQIGMEAFEHGVPSGRRSVARGWSVPQIVYRAPAGKTVRSIDRHNQPIQVLNKVMSGHGSFTAPRTFVGSVTVWGDRRGKDIGFHTCTLIKFDYELPVVIADEPVSRFTAKLPSRVTLMPKLIDGDADFNGNGPNVTVHGSLYHTDTEAQFSLVMIAEESGGGDTVAHGLKTITFFHAPRGFRIKGIAGRKSYRNMITSTDRDLTPNFFNTPFGRAGVYGDRNGPDVGGYTRIELENIQRPVVIELERISR